MTQPSIVWFRRDLRLADQAALTAAAASGPVLCVYVLDDETPRHRAMGGASRWWLHHSLYDLDRRLRNIGSRLLLRRGRADNVVAALVAETGATAVHALRHYEPWWRNAEHALERALPDGVALHLHDGNYLLRPGSVTTGSGSIYKIYTPFWRALAQHMPPADTLPAPKHITPPATWPKSDRLEDWNLLPTKPDWANGFAEDWQPGEESAHKRLDAFLPEAAAYDVARNLPSIEGSSRLSPHLHFGEIAPSRVWDAVSAADGDGETFLKEIVWRDYAQNLILAFPEYGRRNGKEQFDAFPWRDPADPDVAEHVKAWQRGRTGYPIVDAGMRQLWHTGWMHNRVRMIAASFLIKHLLIDWRIGEQWFWDTLVDADYASNSVNWQWVAGTGVDANMFVRIMAPLVQSEKFEAAEYIRRWVPELAGLNNDEIHTPTEIAAKACGYPLPIIGHKQARELALQAFRSIKA